MSSVSADTAQPTLLVCIHHLSPAGQAIINNGVCCVNVLRDDQSFVDHDGVDEVPPRVDDGVIDLGDAPCPVALEERRHGLVIGRGLTDVRPQLDQARRLRLAFLDRRNASPEEHVGRQLGLVGGHGDDECPHGVQSIRRSCSRKRTLRST